MVKKLLIAFGVLGLALLIIVPFSLGSIAKYVTVKVGSRATGTAVHLSQFYLAPWSGRGRLFGFSIDNPPGFQSRKAIKFGSLSVQASPKTFFNDTVVIDEILLRKPEIYYENNETGNNLKRLEANIEKFSPSKKEAGKKLIIRRLVIEEGKLHWENPLLNEFVTLKIPRLELKNLGSGQNGITSAQLISILVQRLDRSALESIATQGVKIPELGKEKVKELGDKLKKIF